MLQTTTPYDCSYYTEPQFYTIAGTCYDLQCSGSTGQSRAWNDFYSAKKERKAAKLADAIKGVGEGTASKFVEKGIFNSKPKSWNDFRSAIKTATQIGIISSEQERMILSTYREDNMSNLGYSSNSCKSVAYSCPEIIITSPSVFVPKTCTDVETQVIGNKAILYKVKVENADLLAGETENINVQLSVDPSQISLEPAYYNQYSTQLVNFNGQTGELLTQGQGRKQVDLPSSYLSNVSISGDYPILQPGEKRGVKMEVDVEIYKTSSNYFNPKVIKKSSNKITLK